MRIDKFLKVSRLIKRREVAKELCDDGDVLLNGKLAKPSTEVVAGDVLEIALGRHRIKAKVNLIQPYANKAAAEGMYTILEDVIIERAQN